MSRLEIALLALGLVSWAAACGHYLGAWSVAGGLDLSLYGLYTLAAAVGWVAGNVAVRRRRTLPPALRRRLLTAYLVCPPGAVILARAMTPTADQAAAPLVPFYALGVYAVFFLVPLTLAAPAKRRLGG